MVRGTDPAVGASKENQTRGIGIWGSLTSPCPRDAAVTLRLVRPRPRTYDRAVTRPGSVRGTLAPLRLRPPAPPALAHRLGRVSVTAAAAAATATAAATAASRHGPASRTPRASRGRGQ